MRHVNKYTQYHNVLFFYSILLFEQNLHARDNITVIILSLKCSRVLLSLEHIIFCCRVRRTFAEFHSDRRRAALRWNAVFDTRDT